MTLPEFKYWLDGFSESVDQAPTPEQWTKIRSKLDEVHTDVFVSRRALYPYLYSDLPEPDTSYSIKGPEITI